MKVNKINQSQINNTIRLSVLDFLKAACIWMVIIQHCEITSLYCNAMLMPFWVELAVPVFFMISGYTLILHSEKTGSIGGYFRKLPSSLLTTLVPYLIVCTVVIVGKTASGTSYTAYETIRKFLMGEFGTGGYFTIVYIQILIIFPLLVYVIKRWKLGGVFLIIAINIVFEIAVCFIDSKVVNIYALYKPCSFRYLAFVAWGIYMFLYRNRLLRTLSKTLKWVICGGYCLASDIFFSYHISTRRYLL